MEDDVHVQLVPVTGATNGEMERVMFVQNSGLFYLCPLV